MDNERPKLRVVHHLARVGGTLICRCLGCMQGVAMFSEVHPYGAALGIKIFDPLYQARTWFGLIDEEEQEQAETLSFGDKISLIHERCEQRGLAMIYRDWTHLDYLGKPFVTDPPMRMRTPEALGDRFELVRTATVRHPVDSWLSLRRIGVFEKLSPGEFMPGYRVFAEEAREMGFVRFEDFVKGPDEWLGVLCERLELEFDGSYEERWMEYKTITGDGSGSRASDEKQIKALKRRKVKPEVLAAFARCPDYLPALQALGYTHAG